MEIRIIFAISLVLGTIAQTCEKFACQTEDQELEADTCQFYDSGTYYMKQCTNSTLPYCPTELDQGSKTCTTPPEPNSQAKGYPGEPCDTDDDCVYQSCFQEKCQGKGYDAQCNSHLECEPGLRCDSDSSSCKLQISKGFTGCTEDADCVNDAGCNAVDGVGKCVSYFSISNGEQVSNCDENYNISNICQSGWCSKNRFSQGGE